MRLNLRDMIHVPGASRSFVFSLVLSELEFNGEFPVKQPVQVAGTVRNMANALLLEGTAVTELALTCDRCLCAFQREMTVPVETLLAERLEDEENDEIILLENGELDLDEVFTTAFILAMDQKHLCAETCKGLCFQCGANLNEGPCKCKSEVDPRLAALAQLLDDKT